MAAADPAAHEAVQAKGLAFISSETVSKRLNQLKQSQKDRTSLNKAELVSKRLNQSQKGRGVCLARQINCSDAWAISSKAICRKAKGSARLRLPVASNRELICAHAQAAHANSKRKRLKTPLCHGVRSALFVSTRRDCPVCTTIRFPSRVTSACQIAPAFEYAGEAGGQLGLDGEKAVGGCARRDGHVRVERALTRRQTSTSTSTSGGGGGEGGGGRGGGGGWRGAFKSRVKGAAVTDATIDGSAHSRRRRARVCGAHSSRGTVCTRGAAAKGARQPSGRA
eukprot:6051609-Pleurochrysis_carterae.AAC.2